MSTKTTFKRIALVAVASLGFGVLTSVAPASADWDNEAAVTDITAISITAPAVGRVGAALATPLGFTSVAALDADEDLTFAAVFTERPAGSTATVIFDATGIDLVGAAGDAGAYDAPTGFMPARYTATSTGTDFTVGAHVAGRVGFIPDAEGTYTIRVWHDQNRNGAIDPTEVNVSRSFTVGGAPTTLTASAINAGFCASGANGALVKLTLPTSTGLALGEAIRVTPSTATADITLVNGQAVTYTPGTTTFVDLAGSSFIGGVAWLNVTDSASVTLTYACQGSSVAAITGSTALTARTCVTGDTGTTVLQGATAGAAFTSITDGINGTSTTATIPLAARTLTYYSAFTAGAAVGDYFGATVTDSDGRVTGSASQSVTGLKYDLAYIGAANATTATTIEGTFSVALSPTATGQGFNVTTGNGTSLVSGVTTAAVVTSEGTATVSPSAALSLKTGGSITYSVTVRDKWNRAIPNAVVGMAITGRNANQTVINPTAVTGSTGIATFTLTDAPAAGTTSLSDSIVFTATGADNSQKAATAVTIAWSATGPVVGKVTILGGNNGTTTGVASATPQVKDIAAGNGAQAGTSAFVATVTDAAGNLLAGVPVTFTVSGTTAAVLSTTQTVYTGALGTASASVYAWVAGDYTVTATAGGVAGTAVLTAAQQTAAEARAISATVSGTIVTAKVVDRFGNNVPGVTVYATKTGPGFFGAGVTSTSAVTSAAGIAEFVIAGGDAEVTVSTLDPNAAAGTLAFGQTCAAAGFVSCATTATALTAATVGTATTAEVGVGASLAAAGVSRATVTVTGDSSSQAAADAAAEATDAANAATDAANAAAEAADAATAAAQDAADAVAALSTQVTELVTALRKQITSLTNLVIKIQRKVRA
jgi:trimeric autotransporter adhesin